MEKELHQQDTTETNQDGGHKKQNYNISYVAMNPKQQAEAEAQRQQQQQKPQQ